MFELKPYEKKIIEELKVAIPVLILIYVYHWISNKYGFENAILSLLVILVFVLRDIATGVKDFGKRT